MRLLSIAILVGLSACSSVPSSNDVSSRTASWQGVSTTELVTALGEPTSMKPGTWIWKFPGPENRQARNGGAPVATSGFSSQPISQPCPGCDRSGSHSPPSNRASPAALPMLSSGRSMDTRRRYCEYIAYVEDGIVAQLTTLSKPGTHCRFQELPLYSN